MIRSLISCNLALCAALLAQSGVPASTEAKTNASPSQTSVQTAKQAPTHYQPSRFAGRAGTYYRLVWGIDGLSVKWAEGGEVIRFTYQVIDPGKAKMLNDKKIEPSLTDEQAQVKLIVPQMDKVGKLRQTSDPVPGRTYWMLFSNKGGHVKRGDRVSVVIGKFRADGLVVD
ncbi:MAG TPA: hypothetical protein VMQ17_00935 [Candidatus Sulfotelmatobacter sp.]|nr:hypothetical protein [Candidatus Sulfotelmatobacter sp.]